MAMVRLNKEENGFAITGIDLEAEAHGSEIEAPAGFDRAVDHGDLSDRQGVRRRADHAPHQAGPITSRARRLLLVSSVP